MYKKLISIVVLSSYIVIPAQAMERKESHYVSDIVKIGSGVVAGTLLMYVAFLRPQQQQTQLAIRAAAQYELKLEKVQKGQKAFGASLEFAYFNRNEECLKKFLSEHGLAEHYKVEQAKMVLNERLTNVLCVIKEKN